ncbi:hypothetical protein [Ruegeria atlantica]|uniref:hypothetical protein n=1 Tax=Ruegeria atlantica TaxID=81569 RepID=UPI00071DE2B9|nr:hypothetical protein [Ruegeria atlantica]
MRKNLYFRDAELQRSTAVAKRLLCPRLGHSAIFRECLLLPEAAVHWVNRKNFAVNVGYSDLTSHPTKKTQMTESSPMQTKHTIAFIANPIVCANLDVSAKKEAQSWRFRFGKKETRDGK